LRQATFSRRWAALTTIAIAATLVTASVRALTTDEILNYNAPDRQKVLEDGARRKGRLSSIPV